MKSRTRARSLALQVLYEVDMTGHLPGTVLQERLEDAVSDGQAALSPDLVEFARQIISGVVPMAEKLDTVIASRDIVAADAYATTLFGLTGSDIGYITACADMGLGTMDLSSTDLREINLG